MENNMGLIVPDHLTKLYEEKNAVAKLGESCLLEVAEPITQFNKQLYDKSIKMIETAKKFNGVGLAGPQIRYNKRILVYNQQGALKGWKAICNPRIIDQPGNYQSSREACLSIPGLHGVVQRMDEIVVAYQNILGKEEVKRFKDYEACIIQHEMDHLDGVLFYTKSRPGSLQWVSDRVS